MQIKLIKMIIMKWLKWIFNNKVNKICYVITIILMTLSCNKNQRFLELDQSTLRAFKQFKGIGYKDSVFKINGIKLQEFSFGNGLKEFDILLGVTRDKTFFCSKNNRSKLFVLFDKNINSKNHFVIPLNLTTKLNVESIERIHRNNSNEEIYMSKFYLSHRVNPFHYISDTIIMKYNFENGILGIEDKSYFSNLDYDFWFYPSFNYRLTQRDSNCLSI